MIFKTSKPYNLITSRPLRFLFVDKNVPEQVETKCHDRGDDADDEHRDAEVGGGKEVKHGLNVKCKEQHGARPHVEAVGRLVNHVALGIRDAPLGDVTLLASVPSLLLHSIS